MANIDIEKDKNKNNSSAKIWLWVIGILILAGIIWWWIAAADDGAEVEEAEVYEQRISQTMEIEPLRENSLLVENFSAI